MFARVKILQNVTFSWQLSIIVQSFEILIENEPDGMSRYVTRIFSGVAVICRRMSGGGRLSDLIASLSLIERDFVHLNVTSHVASRRSREAWARAYGPTGDVRQRISSKTTVVASRGGGDDGGGGGGGRNSNLEIASRHLARLVGARGPDDWDGRQRHSVQVKRENRIREAGRARR
ncbi:hypothetical protein P5V15_009106 [Pogonomyrmex californicus]